MKIGLIGFGSMGKTHLWCVKNLNYFYKGIPFSANYAGVCTSKEESAKKAAEFLGIDINDDDFYLLL